MVKDLNQGIIMLHLCILIFIQRNGNEQKTGYLPVTLEHSVTVYIEWC